MSLVKKKYILAHLSSAEQILAHYEGFEPFPIFIKAFFRDNKKFGSRDRKEISAFCYNFFRLGKAMPDIPIREKILVAQFLCTTKQNSLLEETKPAWISSLDLPLAQKFDFLQMQYPSFSTASIFPFENELSSGLDKDAFRESHFIQPDLFLRIRPGRTKEVRKIMDKNGISFRPIGEDTLALPNTTKLDSLSEPDRLFVIQDLSSQQTADYFPSPASLPRKPAIWDACAGSGGKSIMAYDLFPEASLFVSDERETILHNLRKRFSISGIRNFEEMQIDLTETNSRNTVGHGFFPPKGFDFVIADVPCSGSGTWGRNPWEMLFFPETGIEHYQQLQQNMMLQIIPRVKTGGFLLYITCSVYQAENEGIVEFIKANSQLQLQKSGLIKGYDCKADSMFAALFTLPV